MCMYIYIYMYMHIYIYSHVLSHFGCGVAAREAPLIATGPGYSVVDGRSIAVAGAGASAGGASAGGASAGGGGLMGMCYERYEAGWKVLWFFNIAMENDPFIDGLPIKNGDFPWLC